MTKPTTPKQYLDSLPPERRTAISKLRAEINRNLPKGYKEGIQYGMLAWFVPHSRYPEGYHCNPKEPLPFASLASQKNHMGIYLFCIYGDPKLSAWFQKEWKKTGKKLDMGKSCVRSKNIEVVPEGLVGEAVSRIPMDAFMARHEQALPASVKKKRAAKKKAAGKKAAKEVAAKKEAAKRKAARR
jgi:hypothetical protein